MAHPPKAPKYLPIILTKKYTIPITSNGVVPTASEPSVRLPKSKFKPDLTKNNNRIGGLK